jgi:alpha-methylacyl-CoA racemase
VNSTFYLPLFAFDFPLFTHMSGPLASLKIVDFSTLLPGPFASMMLADLGADVVRIEAPHRPDLVRQTPPFDGEDSTWHTVLNRNKRSLALDLKQPVAIEIVKRLLEPTSGGYDILLEQFRPGAMARLGLDYETLRLVNPGLIYCALTGYGQTGPYRERAGHDLNYLALSGMMSYSGRTAGGPPPLGVQVADIGGGSWGAVMGILAAVIHRQQTGEGQLVDVAMLDMAVAWQSHTASNFLAAAETPAAEGMSLNGGTFYDYYETEDGRFLTVAALEPKFWAGFCTAIGRPDLTEAAHNQDPAAQQSLKAEVRAVIAQKTVAEWTAVFSQHDVCVEPVLTVPEMAEHPQVQARGLIVGVPRGDGSSQSQIGHPLKFSATSAAYRHTGTAVGAHTAQLLATIGYTQAELDSFQAQGVFG